MKKKFISSLIIFCLFFHALNYAQVVRWIDERPIVASSDTIAGELALLLQTSNFVKDNEYFNRIVEGYTLIGFWAEPVLRYNIGSQTFVQAGLSTVRFFGRKGFYATEPILSVQHWFSHQVSLTMGSIPYSQHGMPAPLFDPERFYLKRVDNGAVFQVASSFFSSETWLSWDRFSFYGDSLQEQISAGSSNLLKVLKIGNFEMHLPLYWLVTHRGGQVVRPKQPIETLVNAGAGINLIWKSNQLSIDINPNFFLYRKITSFPSQPFTNGWAFYPVMHLSYGPVVWECSWWHGRRFIAPKGEKIYSQLSTYEPGFIENTHNVGVNKFAYRLPLTRGMQLEAAMEGYYFFAEKRLDYNFWVHFNWNFRRRLMWLTP